MFHHVSCSPPAFFRLSLPLLLGSGLATYTSFIVGRYGKPKVANIISIPNFPVYFKLSQTSVFIFHNIYCFKHLFRQVIKLSCPDINLK